MDKVFNADTWERGSVLAGFVAASGRLGGKGSWFYFSIIGGWVHRFFHAWFRDVWEGWGQGGVSFPAEPPFA